MVLRKNFSYCPNCGEPVKEDEDESSDKHTELSDNPVTGLRMDVLDKVIDDLGKDPEIKRIVGVPVLEKLAVVAEANDLKIIHLPNDSEELDEDEEVIFANIITEVVSKYMS
jgi:hypothetical protein